MTKITSKQFKIVDNVNFNDNAIENALINAANNTITGLQTSNIENLDNELNNINNEINGVTNSLLEINTNKQDTLISGTTIKTINNESILGSGNIVIQGGGGVGTTTYWGEIEGNIENQTDLQSALNNKQDMLIAGEGITIGNNVISRTETQIINLVIEDTYSYITLTANNTYTLNCDNTIMGVDITLNTPADTSINNSILVHTYIQDISTSFNYGTNVFFNNEQPSISAAGYYDIVYVYNNLLSSWVCKVVLISAEAL